MYQNNTNGLIVACNVPAVSPRRVRPAFRPQPLVGELCSAVSNQHRAHIESLVQITRILHAVVQLQLPPRRPSPVDYEREHAIHTTRVGSGMSAGTMLHRPAALHGATHTQTMHLAVTSHCAAPATAWRGRVVVAFMLVMGLAALDVAAALPAPSADPHLAAFFSFDSWLAPGEVFPDDSGNGWNLQLVAGAATSRASAELHAAGDAPALPKFGPGALSLSGLPGQFAICGIPIASDAAATFTASVWLNPTAGNGSSASPQVVVANRANDPNSDAPFWALERAGSAVRLSVRSAAQVTPSVSPPVHIPTGAWTHVAVSRSAAGAWVLYVDGVASYDAVIPGAVQLDAEDARLIVVGGRTPFAPAGATSTLAGMLDNLRLYSTTLSAADVAGLVTGDEAPPQPLALPGQGWEASFTMKERSWGSSVAGSFDQVWESTGSAFFDSVHRRAVRRSTQSLMDDAGNTLLAQGVNEYVIGSGDGFWARMCSAAHCVCTFVCGWCAVGLCFPPRVVRCACGPHGMCPHQRTSHAP